MKANILGRRKEELTNEPQHTIPVPNHVSQSQRVPFLATLVLAIAWPLAFSGCGQTVFGMHDFGSPIEPDKDSPGPILYGWVQTRDSEPVYAICFVSIKTYFRGDLCTTDEDGRIKAVYGHRVHPSLSGKAIYALQPDLSLKKLPLSPEETDRLLMLFDRNAGIGRADGEEWKVFKAKILARLTTFTFPTSNDSTFRAVSNSNYR